MRRLAQQDGGRRPGLLRPGDARPLGAEAKPDPQLAEKIAAATKAYEAAKKEFEAIRGTPRGLAKAPDGLPKQRPFRLKMVKLQNELLALTDPANGKVAFGVRDAKTIADTEIRVRGEAEKLGPVVPRGFLSVSPIPDVPKINPSQSGRLELAQWLTSEKNPLTPRVMVNRVWQHLFGKGLVQSVDNFGVTGDVPSHPELLDYLAARVRSRRLVGQEAGAADRLEPGLSAWRPTCRKPTSPSTRPTG